MQDFPSPVSPTPHDADERQRQLEAENARLRAELASRQAAAAALAQAKGELDARMAERTAELTNLNRILRAAVEERRRGEEHYRALVETAPGAILRVDAAGFIRFCNQQAFTLFGAGATADLRGRPIDDLAIPEQRAAFRLHTSGAAGADAVEHTLRRLDGSPFDAEVRVAPIGFGSAPLNQLVVIQDISPRKGAERALQTAYVALAGANQALSQQRELLVALVDGLDEGLLLLSEAERVQLANRALADLLGLTPEQIEGEAWPAIQARLSSGSADWGPEAGGQVRRARFVDAEGRTRILELRRVDLAGSRQTIVRVADITTTVQLQRRLITNERFAAAGRLAASVAHEINTPLQSIQTALKLFTATRGDERFDYSAEALREAQRVGRIVHQLLDIYRPAPGHDSPVPINPLIERLALLLRKRALDQHVRLELELADGIPPVLGRADELTQLLLNLVANALEAMPAGGILRVATAAGDGRVVISCADSGPGIPAELGERIFDSFVTSKPQGTGLGLAISRQIVERHGGTIAVASEPGRGATFTVVLPATGAADAGNPWEAADGRAHPAG